MTKNYKILKNPEKRFSIGKEVKYREIEIGTFNK